METSTPPPLTQNGDRDHPAEAVVDSSAPKTKIAAPAVDGTPKQRLKEQIQDFININTKLEERLIELERQMKDKDEKILKLEMTQSQSKARTSSASDSAQIQKAIKAATEEQDKKIEKLQKQLREKEKAAKKAEEEAAKKASADLKRKLEEAERRLRDAEEENKRLLSTATSNGGGGKVPAIVPKLNFANIKAGKEEFTPPPAARGRPERTPNTGGSQTDRTHNRSVFQLSSRLEQLATPRTVTPKAEAKTSTTPRNLNSSISPGPGQYSTYSPLEDTFQRRNSYVFVSKSPRFKDANWDSPGPGQYSAQADAPRNPTPGMSSKSPRFRKDDTVSPGPCAYDGEPQGKRPVSAVSTPFKSKSGRDPMKTGVYGNKGTSESPGPAKYARPSSAPTNKTAAHVFKSKTERFTEPRRGKDSPGPGVYGSGEEKVQKSKASAAYKSKTTRFPTKKTVAPDMTKYDANNDSIGEVAEKAARRPSATFASKNDRFSKR